MDYSPSGACRGLGSAIWDHDHAGDWTVSPRDFSDCHALLNFSWVDQITFFFFFLQCTERAVGSGFASFLCLYYLSRKISILTAFGQHLYLHRSLRRTHPKSQSTHLFLIPEKTLHIWTSPVCLWTPFISTLSFWAHVVAAAWGMESKLSLKSKHVTSEDKMAVLTGPGPPTSIVASL